MPKPNEPSGEEIKKAAMVTVVANFLMWPFYFVDSKLGLAASIAATTTLLYAGAQVAEEKKDESKPFFHSFFAADNKTETMEERFNASVAGLAEIYDKFTPKKP